MNESSGLGGTYLLWLFLSGSILLNLYFALKKRPDPVLPTPERAPDPAPIAMPLPEMAPEIGFASEAALKQEPATEPDPVQEPLGARAPEPAPAREPEPTPIREDLVPSQTLELSENEERFASRLLHQLAHDIRSPLAHLMVIASQEEQQTFDSHLRDGIREATQRLKEVARKLTTLEGLDDLLQRSPEMPESLEPRPVAIQETPSSRNEIVPEIATAGNDPVALSSDITESAPDSAPSVQAPRVRRARPTPGQRLEDEQPEVQLLEPILESLCLRIQDRIGLVAKLKWWNGNGFGIFVNIPRRKFVSDILKALDVEKDGGSGTITLEVRNPEGRRLEIGLRAGDRELKPIALTSCDAPDWFADQIALPKDCSLVILDDDPSIHRLWAQRLKNLPCTPIHLRDHESAVEWYRTHWSEGQNIFWLCDHDLGADSRTGLETIELLGVQDEALLVTSRFEDPEVQARVIRQGVRILPKLLAPIAPIEWMQRQPS